MHPRCHHHCATGATTAYIPSERETTSLCVGDADIETAVDIDNSAIFKHKGVRWRVQLSKSGIHFKRLGHRRWWAPSEKLPHFLPFREILSVSTDQHAARQRCCYMFCKERKVWGYMDDSLLFLCKLCSEFSNMEMIHYRSNSLCECSTSFRSHSLGVHRRCRIVFTCPPFGAQSTSHAVGHPSALSWSQRSADPLLWSTLRNAL